MMIGLDGKRERSELNPSVFVEAWGQAREKGRSVPIGKELMLSGIVVVLGTLVPVGLWGCARQLVTTVHLELCLDRVLHLKTG